MKRALTCLFLATLLTACSGVPLRSMPRLMKLQHELLEANPAEFMLAIQADARMTPRSNAAPLLQVSMRPAEAGAFEAVEKQLPMRLSIASSAALGLDAPGANRRWFIYSFPPESQAELARIQNYFKRIEAERRGKRGGSLSLGIKQDSVAPTDPALANTRWESWLQTSRREGFFELWSGTVGALLDQGKRAAARSPQ
jgi:hypothetical protein